MFSPVGLDLSQHTFPIPRNSFQQESLFSQYSFPEFTCEECNNLFGEPAAVASPPGEVLSASDASVSEIGYEFMIGNFSEGSVAGGARHPPAEALPFIPCPEPAETRLSDEVTGYWQRRGKSSARLRIRDFLLKGKCKWNQVEISTPAGLAAHFDPQLIATVTRQVEAKRK